MAEVARADDNVFRWNTGLRRIAILAAVGLLAVAPVGCAGHDPQASARAPASVVPAVLAARVVEAEYAAVLEETASYLASERVDAASVRQLQILDEAVGSILVRLRLAVRSGDGDAVERDLMIARVAVSQLANCLATQRNDPVPAAWL